MSNIALGFKSISSSIYDSTTILKVKDWRNKKNNNFITGGRNNNVSAGNYRTITGNYNIAIGSSSFVGGGYKTITGGVYSTTQNHSGTYKMI